MKRWADMTRDEQDEHICLAAMRGAAKVLAENWANGHKGWRNRIYWDVCEPGHELPIPQSMADVSEKLLHYFTVAVWQDAGGIRAQITKRPRGAT